MVYFGGTNAKFYALDANTGALKWTYAGEQSQPLVGVYGQPAVDQGVVYFAALNGSQPPRLLKVAVLRALRQISN